VSEKKGTATVPPEEKKRAVEREAFLVPERNPWSKAWQYAGGVGALGIVGAVVGYGSDPKRFAFSYLFAFQFTLSICLGMLFFVLTQHLTSAGWSVTVRRTAEIFSTGFLALVVLFAPVYLSRNELFPWLGHEGGHNAHAEHTSKLEKGVGTTELTQAPAPGPHGAATGEAPAEHGSGRGGGRGGGGGQASGDRNSQPEPGGVPGTIPPGHPPIAGAHSGSRGAPGAAHAHAGTRGDPHELIEHEILAGKKPYLNLNFWSLRIVLYFAIWIFMAWRLYSLSTTQDKTRDPKLTVAMQRFSPPATVVFGLTLTFAGFDWIMSLLPTWFSTIFGVYLFAGSVVGSYALLILVTMGLRSTGLLLKEINIEHYHDLGKLMFGFNIFWAYIGFSQFMLIWYAALPEETPFFHMRWNEGPWAMVSLSLVFLHFVVPFVFLISRNVKRRLPMLAAGSVLLLVMHAVDCYWLVMPNYGQEGFNFHWLDLACVLGVGGVYLAFVLFRMSKTSLIPVGDPRLKRALAFENA
jgi:hypothetical protein